MMLSTATSSEIAPKVYSVYSQVNEDLALEGEKPLWLVGKKKHQRQKYLLHLLVVCLVMTSLLFFVELCKWSLVYHIHVGHSFVHHDHVGHFLVHHNHVGHFLIHYAHVGHFLVLFLHLSHFHFSFH